MTNNSTPAAAAALAAIRTARSATNPWEALAHSRAAAAYSGTDDHSYEAAAIRSEYAGHDGEAARHCRCGEQALHYRASVGAYKCIACGAVQTQAGKYLA